MALYLKSIKNICILSIALSSTITLPLLKFISTWFTRKKLNGFAKTILTSHCRGFPNGIRCSRSTTILMGYFKSRSNFLSRPFCNMTTIPRHRPSSHSIFWRFSGHICCSCLRPPPLNLLSNIFIDTYYNVIQLMLSTCRGNNGYGKGDLWQFCICCCAVEDEIGDLYNLSKHCWSAAISQSALPLWEQEHSAIPPTCRFNISIYIKRFMIRNN